MMVVMVPDVCISSCALIYEYPSERNRRHSEGTSCKRFYTLMEAPFIQI